MFGTKRSFRYLLGTFESELDVALAISRPKFHAEGILEFRIRLSNLCIAYNEM